jgi:response regulator RpfG family c-di-GMP phosphodiesterase
MQAILSDIHFIEDSEDEVFISRLLLKRGKFGGALIHHTSESSFRQALETKGPDAVVLAFVDLNMPGKKGTEIVAEVLEKFKDSVIIGICSGSEDPEDMRLSFLAGAHFFVNKPLARPAIEAACEAVPRLGLKENSEGNIQITCSVC